MTGLRLCLALVALLPGCAACTAGKADAAGAIDLCGYRLAFADEFRDLSISPHMLGDARWTAHTPWNGDFGDAAFVNPGPEGPFRIAEGKLEITASRNAKGQWRSGLIAAADETGKGSGLRYGYFEARMKLPPGPGTWPAFWLISLKPAEDRAPKVEIDVIEYYGHDDASYHVASHVWYKPPDTARTRHEGRPIAVPPGSLTRGFHDYGVSVDPRWITFYLDRRPVWQRPTPPELKTPLYPLIDLALGSGYPIDKTPDPSVLSVDYVRVYAPDPRGRRDRCSP